MLRDPPIYVYRKRTNEDTPSFSESNLSFVPTHPIDINNVLVFECNAPLAHRLIPSTEDQFRPQSSTSFPSIYCIRFVASRQCAAPNPRNGPRVWTASCTVPLLWWRSHDQEHRLRSLPEAQHFEQCNCFLFPTSTDFHPYTGLRAQRTVGPSPSLSMILCWILNPW